MPGPIKSIEDLALQRIIQREVDRAIMRHGMASFQPDSGRAGGKPPVVSGLSVSGSRGAMTITWNDVAHKPRPRYRVEIADNQAFSGAQVINTFNNQLFWNEDLDTTTTYYVRIRAEGGSNFSQIGDFSAVLNTTTGQLTASDIASVPESAVNEHVLGVRDRFIWAEDLFPQTTDGCASLAQVELVSGRPEIRVLDFDSTSAEFAQWIWSFPESWDAGTVRFRFFWLTASSSSNGVAWTASGVARTNANATIGSAQFPNAIIINDLASGTANELLVSPWTSDVTIGGADDDALIWFQFGRDPSDTFDTLSADARLLGVQMEYSVDAATDAK